MKYRFPIAAFMLTCFALAGSASPSEPPAPKDLQNLPSVEAAVNDSRLRGDMLIVNVIVGFYPLVTEPYFVVPGGVVTLDGKPATFAAVNERVAKGRIRVTLHPRVDRYGMVTDAEFTSETSAAAGTQLTAPVVFRRAIMVGGQVFEETAPGVFEPTTNRFTAGAVPVGSVSTVVPVNALIDRSFLHPFGGAFLPGRSACPGGVCPTPRR